MQIRVRTAGAALTAVRTGTPGAAAADAVAAVRTPEVAMSQPVLSRPAAARPRSLAAVDDDLRSCRRIRRDAERELAEVRRRQEELADLEATLLVTLDCRSRLVDHLLDERLRVRDDGCAPRS
ncbi:hypothetical protein E9529_16000 [Blastococcus sp. KM273128]|uniref:hypothetical protein n=1 Tax=Blastococcus sp. KM273128 TaxID=2570314 RepID=UPI001F2BC56C|nr:hypothetical protein [Blastococcus sp. KM273128]MCF6745750.1 hypothetical protein [Blastococcus sp. KM273128]